MESEGPSRYLYPKPLVAEDWNNGWLWLEIDGIKTGNR